MTTRKDSILELLFLLTFALAVEMTAEAEGPDLPNPLLTLGAVRADCTMADICPHANTKAVRHVSAKLRRSQCVTYLNHKCPKGEFEMDHLISLELCGSNDPKNLWPEHYSKPHGAREKDVVENRLHREVCAGTIELEAAQECIATDWLTCK